MKNTLSALWPLRCTALCLVGLIVALSACTPALDWRDVRNEEGGYRALFPGKPAMASRDFVIAGQTVTLKLQATTVNGAYFSVGEIGLSETQQANAQTIVDALKASRRNNIGAADAQERAVPAGAIIWQEIRAQGKLASGAPAILAGRFVVQPGRIVEVLAMGERAQLSDETIDMWLGSFALESKP